MNALVLSGGSVKGCFQAGAIKATIESGFIPKTIYGISVGALNGSFLAQKAGELCIQKGAPLDQNDWNEIGESLCQYWRDNIKQPSDVAIQKGIIGDIINIALNNFTGLADTDPVYQKIDQLLDLNTLRTSPVTIKVGAVDMITGDLTYLNAGEGDFINYVKGSMAIPIAMPPANGGMNEVLFDGGTREVAPLGVAINDQASNIVGILCQPENLDVTGSDFTTKNLMKLMDRIEDIIVDQNVKNDSEWITFINQVVRETKGMNIPSLASYKTINHILIRPDKTLNIIINKFNAEDIANNIQLGYDLGMAKFTANPLPWIV